MSEVISTPAASNKCQQPIKHRRRSSEGSSVTYPGEAETLSTVYTSLLCLPETHYGFLTQPKYVEARSTPTNVALGILKPVPFLIDFTIELLEMDSCI